MTTRGSSKRTRAREGPPRGGPPTRELQETNLRPRVADLLDTARGHPRGDLWRGNRYRRRRRRRRLDIQPVSIRRGCVCGRHLPDHDHIPDLARRHVDHDLQPVLLHEPNAHNDQRRVGFRHHDRGEGPTSTLFRDCPSSDETVHEVTYGNDTYMFRKFCNTVLLTNGLLDVGATIKGDLDSCINECARHNYQKSSEIESGKTEKWYVVSWRHPLRPIFSSFWNRQARKGKCQVHPPLLHVCH